MTYTQQVGHFDFSAHIQPWTVKCLAQSEDLKYG